LVPEAQRGPGQPVLKAALFWDGHTLHNNERVTQLLQEHNIVSIIFTPHATHLIQPLDVLGFNVFKNHFRDNIRALIERKERMELADAEKSDVKPSKPELREIYLTAVRNAAMQTFTPTLVQDSFNTSGLPSTCDRMWQPEKVIKGNSMVTETQQRADAM